MLKILIGVGLGFLLFQSPQAREITADVMRSGADLLDPPPKTIPEVVGEFLDKD